MNPIHSIQEVLECSKHFKSLTATKWIDGEPGEGLVSVPTTSPESSKWYSDAFDKAVAGIDGYYIDQEAFKQHLGYH
jgi:hypothetical protein